MVKVDHALSVHESVFFSERLDRGQYSPVEHEVEDVCCQHKCVYEKVDQVDG